MATCSVIKDTCFLLYNNLFLQDGINSNHVSYHLYLGDTQSFVVLLSKLSFLVSRFLFKKSPSNSTTYIQLSSQVFFPTQTFSFQENWLHNWIHVIIHYSFRIKGIDPSLTPPPLTYKSSHWFLPLLFHLFLPYYFHYSSLRVNAHHTMDITLSNLASLLLSDNTKKCLYINLPTSCSLCFTTMQKLLPVTKNCFFSFLFKAFYVAHELTFISFFHILAYLCAHPLTYSLV